MKTKHTPLPWTLYPHKSGQYYAIVKHYCRGDETGPMSRTIAIILRHCEDVEAKASAEFLVTACNSYDALLSACKSAHESLGRNLAPGERELLADELHTAIAAVEGDYHD